MSTSIRVRPLAGKLGAALHFKFLVLLAFTVAAIVVLPASAGAHSSFGVSAFDVAPSTTTQSAHPNLSVSFDRTGSSSEDLKDFKFAFPAGLTLDPTAVTKCTSTQFNTGKCPAASNVGSFSAGIKFGLGPFAFGTKVDGTVYALSNTQLGVITGPGLFPYTRFTQTLTPGASGGTIASVENLSHRAALFGIITVDITVTSIDFDYRGFAGAGGPAFVTNPATCTLATTTLTAVSWRNVTRTATDSFTPTGCGTGPSAPVVNITAPADNALIASANVPVSFTATNSPTSVTCKLDSAAAAACTSPQTYAALTDGAHTVVVSASNAGGAGSDTVNFTVDTTAPNTTITANPTNPSASTSASFSFTSSEAGSTFSCKLDAAAAASCTSPKTYSGLAAGSHTFTVVATDAAGNADATPATYTWTITGAPPTVSISSPTPAQLFNTGSVNVTFSTSGGVAPVTTTCAIDGGAASSCTTPKSYTGLTDGNHTVVVAATDAVAATGSASVTFSVDTTAPNTTITSQPANPTNLTNASFSFTSSEAGSTFSCKLDASAAAACTSPKTYSGLAVGSHTFTVAATDAAGNTDATPASYTWSITAATPLSVSISAPTAGQVFNTSTVGVTFAVSGGTGPYTTTCAIDGGAASSCTSPKSYTGLTDGSHTVVVSATDSLANAGSGSVTFTVDTTAPNTTITAQPSNPTNLTNASFSFTSSEAGSAFSCKLDAAAAAACTSPKTYSGLALGSHTFTVAATDAAGNTDATPASYTWSITAATPLSVSISAPTPGQVFNTSTVGVTFAVSGGTGPYTTTCAIDGGAASSCTSPKSYTGLTDGSHTVVVSATDSLANAGSGSVTFTVDTTAPNTTITAQPSNPTNLTDASFSFTSSEAGSTFSCKLDAGAAASCTSPKAYSGLTVGSHTFTVAATDAAGNTDATPATYTWTIAVATPLSVSISAPTAGQVFNTSTVGVTFAVSGGTGPYTTTCAIDGGAASSCTSPKSYTGLTDGSHTVVVSATDSLANAGSGSVTFTVDTTAPNTTITAQPANPTNLTNASFSFTSSEAGSTFSCKLDAAAAAACTSPKTYSGLAVGSHTFTVAATDAAGNTDATPASYTWAIAAATPLTVTISSPTPAQVFNTSTVGVTFSVSGGTGPYTTTCAIDGGAATSCTSPKSYTALTDGNHTVVVAATDTLANAGSASIAFAVDTTAPNTTITANPTNPTPSTDASFSFTSSEAGSTFSCKLDAAAAASCTSPKAYTGLATGSHTFTVAATDAAGNTDATPASFTWTIASAGVAPTLTLTSVPGPSTANQTPSYTFTTTGTPAPTTTCSVDGGAAAACTSPFTPSSLSSQAIHTITITASNGTLPNATKSTSTWVDTRAYGVAVTVTKQANSLTPAGTESNPAAHPSVLTQATLQGAADTKALTITLPHGLSGSLAAIPKAQRCTDAQYGATPAAFNCPASAIVGTGTGFVAVTDSGTQVAASGSGYLMTAPSDASAPARIAVKVTIAGGRGDVVAQGKVNLINNGSSQQAVADNIPTTTSTGVAFHALSLDVQLDGTVGGAAHPLITNQSYCGTPATSGTGNFAPFGPSPENASANPNGYKGQFNSVIGNLTSYSATTATVTVPYTVTNCSNTVTAYAPTITQTLSNPTAGASSAVTATITQPADQSSTQRIFVKEPPKIGPNFGAFGNPTAQCPSASANAAGTVGIGNAPFDPSTCPATARIGQAKIFTPLLETPIVADVYLINKSPLPWLGIHVDPSITYPGRPAGETNPENVTVNLLSTTATPTVHSTCSSGAGDPNCGIGQSSCDLDSQVCQSQITVSAPILPDIPLTGFTLYLGRLADGVTQPSGRIGVNGITTNDPVTAISSGDNTCPSGIDPNTAGADTGGGTPFTQQVSTQFTAWSRTNSVGSLLAGTSLVTVNQNQTIAGC